MADLDNEDRVLYCLCPYHSKSIKYIVYVTQIT